MDNKVEVNNGVDQSMNNGNEDDGFNEFVEKRKKKKNKSKNRRKSINTKKSNAFEKQNW